MPTLHAHPFSSYCQKVITALHEHGLDFTFRELAIGDEEADAEFGRLWPLKRMPVLVDGDRTVAESSIIIEYLGVVLGGLAPLIPSDPVAALDVRFMDRVFDNYVMAPVQMIVFDAMRSDEARDPQGVDRSRALLDQAYAWLDERMAGRTWACGDAFSLADCAAAPSLFYADWTHEIGDRFPAVRAYRSRLLARPSFARAVDAARPYRSFFPLGAPDRD